MSAQVHAVRGATHSQTKSLHQGVRNLSRPERLSRDCCPHLHTGNEAQSNFSEWSDTMWCPQQHQDVTKLKGLDHFSNTNAWNSKENCFRNSCYRWVWHWVITRKTVTGYKPMAPKMSGYARTVVIPKTQTEVCKCEELHLPEKMVGMCETFSRDLISPIKKTSIHLPIPIISSFCSLHCFT